MSSVRTATPEKNRKESAREWERLQLRRLLWAMILFFAVFLGKQIYPGNIVLAGERMMEVLSRSVDVEAVFTRLGTSMTREGGVLEGLEEFCVTVFGAQKNDMPQTEQAAIFPPKLPVVYSGLLKDELEKSEPPQEIIFEPEPSACVPAGQKPEATPAVGTVLTTAKSSQDFPEGYTGDELCFGDLKTVAPVQGQLNSGFGYRDHPISGTYSFHAGADISAEAGDPIGAFASGEVEYVGEDDSYGLYLQLDHGNGIKSFYAHCQSVCVEKGEHVEIGQTVARVGSTGSATGPHLHLELKCCGMRVDPSYYVEFL